MTRSNWATGTAVQVVADQDAQNRYECAINFKNSHTQHGPKRPIYHNQVSWAHGNLREHDLVLVDLEYELVYILDI